MDFSLSEDETLIRDTAREFARKKLMPRAREIDTNQEIPRELIKEMGELGLLGMTIPEKYGGTGATITQTALVASEIGYGDISMATAVYFLLDSGWPRIVADHGSEKLKDEILPKVVTGEQFVGIASTEPGGGSDLANIKTRAKKTGGGWHIKGEKTFISGAIEAERHGGGHLVLAKTGDGGYKDFEFFYVPAKGGKNTSKKFENMGRMGISTCVVDYDIEVPDHYRLGEELGSGFKMVMGGFNAARVLVSAACIGASHRALDMGMEYIKERHAFGRPIGKFEGIQFELADLYGKLKMVEDQVYKGGWYVDNHPEKLDELIRTVAIGKLYAPQVAFEIIQKVMMWFGAISYSKEFDIEMGMRGIMSYLVGAEGSLNMMRVLLGRELLGREFIPYK